MQNQVSRRQLNTDVLLSGLGLACLTALLGATLAQSLELSANYLWRVIAGFSITVSAIGLFAYKTPDLHRFSAANQITLVRVALVALIAAALGETATAALSWTIVGVVTVALVLDGFDGYVARRTNTNSAFGARFDMETDAALIMILSALCWQFGKAGIWVLAAGAMRYCFLLAAQIFQWMRVPLPASRRRQTVCILQSAGLLGVISPLVPHPASAVLAAGTLVMLTASFAIDVNWLWARKKDYRARPCAR